MHLYSIFWQYYIINIKINSFQIFWSLFNPFWLWTRPFKWSTILITISWSTFWVNVMKWWVGPELPFHEGGKVGGSDATSIKNFSHYKKWHHSFLLSCHQGMAILVLPLNNFFLQNRLRLGAQSVTLLSTLKEPTQLRQSQCATRQQHPFLLHIRRKE